MNKTTNNNETEPKEEQQKRKTADYASCNQRLSIQVQDSVDSLCCNVVSMFKMKKILVYQAMRFLTTATELAYVTVMKMKRFDWSSIYSHMEI